MIRDASSADQPPLDELTRLAFEELRRIYRPSQGAVSAKAALDASLARIVAVDERDDIVGTVQYRIEVSRLHLLGLAVDPTHRRLGVARRLVDHLVETACRRSLEVVSLYTVKETGNPAVFERLGFRTIREQPDAWCIGVDGQPVTEVYMERDSSAASHTAVDRATRSTSTRQRSE